MIIERADSGKNNSERKHVNVRSTTPMLTNTIRAPKNAYPFIRGSYTAPAGSVWQIRRTSAYPCAVNDRITGGRGRAAPLIYDARSPAGVSRRRPPPSGGVRVFNFETALRIKDDSSEIIFKKSTRGRVTFPNSGAKRRSVAIPLLQSRANTGLNKEWDEDGDSDKSRAEIRPEATLVKPNVIIGRRTSVKDFLHCRRRVKFSVSSRSIASQLHSITEETNAVRPVA
ncbi:hypothetical protein EVAR_98092_1 [Eumeta japonica]|uniref:Uncharacterized protein n=1 Tax=Eumeta variegata TaxID=151549 RepID=A0A4C1XKQ4_EUMVA|nr:hypothetical protein EVAR_98092_1 [Eumeta japonica]